MTIVLDSEAAIRRALAQVGQPDGAGACLANVYKWFGSVQSTGPGAGQYNWAIKGWAFAKYRHAGDWNPPPGVPVYFGTDTPRTDKNAPAGDVVLSIGGGRVVCTDGPSGNTEVMTIAARAAEVRRNYLGWTADFLGHPVSGALSYIREATQGALPKPPIIIVRKPYLQEDTMLLIQNSTAIALFTGKDVVGLPIKDINALQAAGVPLAKLSDEGFRKLERL